MGGREEGGVRDQQAAAGGSNSKICMCGSPHVKCQITLGGSGIPNSAALMPAKGFTGRAPKLENRFIVPLLVIFRHVPAYRARYGSIGGTCCQLSCCEIDCALMKAKCCSLFLRFDNGEGSPPRRLENGVLIQWNKKSFLERLVMLFFWSNAFTKLSGCKESVRPAIISRPSMLVVIFGNSRRLSSNG